MHRAKARFLACTFVRFAQSAFTEPCGRDVLGNSGTEGAVSAPLPLRFLKTCATAPGVSRAVDLLLLVSPVELRVVSIKRPR